MCDEGRLEEAIQAVDSLGQRGIRVTSQVLQFLLLECTRRQDLTFAKRVQSLISSTGHSSNIYLHNYLIRLFAACKCLSAATEVFRSVSKPDVHTWQAIIAAHACDGHAEQAIKLYHEMLQSDVKPNNYVHVAVLKACTRTAALADGRVIHDKIRSAGSESNLYVGNSLIDMYSKCRSVDEAATVFNTLRVKDIVSWQTMIGAYVQHGRMSSALELLQEMEHQQVKLSKVVALGVLKACGSLGKLDEGRRIHMQIVRAGLDLDTVVITTLIRMYTKCGSLVEAQKLFEEQQERPLASWNALIVGYAELGFPEKAIELLKRMQLNGVEPDRITFLAVLKACDGDELLAQCPEVFEQLISSGFQVTADVGNVVVRIYGKLGKLTEAQRVFDSVAHKDLALWSTMIAVLTDHGHFHKATQLFKSMEEQGVQPDRLTFVHLLKASGNTLDLKQCTMIHRQLVKSEVQLDVVLVNTLIAMYAKCGGLQEARQLFERLPERTVASWNAIIGGYAQHGKSQEALKLFQQMHAEGMKPDLISILAVLKACAKAGAVDEGKKIHSLLVADSTVLDAAIGSSLIDMYAKSGDLDLAREVFEQLPQRSTVTWNAMIGGYALFGYGKNAWELFQRMQDEGIEVSRITLLSILKICGASASIDQCKQIHRQVRAKGLESDAAIGNTLVDMYARAGDLHAARIVFDKLAQKDVVSWNAMLGGYSQHGQGTDAFHLYQKMQQEGIKPDLITFLNVLKGLEGTEYLDRGREIHARLQKYGLYPNDIIGCSLIDMYAKCGSMDDAQQVFFCMSTRDVASWTAIVGGYVQCGDGNTALQLFQQMQQEGIQPDRVAFLSALRAAGSIFAVEQVQHIHSQLSTSGVLSDTMIVNTLVDAYSKCGSLIEARNLFDGLTEKTVVSWNAMITGYVQHEQSAEALALFQQMKQEGVVPDKVTLLSILKACGTFAALDLGQQVHAHLVESRIHLDATLGNVLIGMYSKCGAMDKAREVFSELSSRDLLSWTTLIGGYAQNEQGGEALKVFQQMLLEGFQPDRATYLSILKACSNTAALDVGKEIHAHIINRGVETDAAVGTKLLDMYVKCGKLDEARKLFGKLPERPSATWNALIAGYTQRGMIDEVKKLFRDMQEEGARPNRMTFLSILKDCSGIAALNQGTQVHEKVLESGLECDETIGNALIDMYANCGSLLEARQLFDSLLERTVVSWNTMIGAYAQHGNGKEALQLFRQMQLEGIKPDDVTIICVLSGCSHSGLVEEGCEIFTSASEKYSLTLSPKHYACMVDLLCRAGFIKEAEDFVRRMPVPADSNTWMSILGACQKHGNAEVASRAFRALVDLDPAPAAAYILMANVYATCGQWDKVADVREQMRTAGVTKLPGRTWIEDENQVQQFIVEDFAFPFRQAIYDELEGLNGALALPVDDVQPSS